MAFAAHAATHYRTPDGTPTSEATNYKNALRPLRELYGSTPAAAFGPLGLRTVVDHMVRMDWARSRINRDLGRVKHVFKWAASHELVPAPVFHGLATVGGLRAGRTAARETAPVRPVPDELLAAVLPTLPAHLSAMVTLQLLAGMRPGEVCRMRGCDLDASEEVWVYTPAGHKTAHHGHGRHVLLGPKARAVIAPFLKPDPRAYLFSPADAEAARRAAMHAARTTPMSCGNAPGTNRAAKPARRPGERYSTASYAHAVTAACGRAFPLPAHLARHKGEGRRAWLARLTDAERADVRAWRKAHHFHPNQLRHNAATRLRREFGLEAAQVVLGHKHANVTQVYAERDVRAARDVMAKVG